MGFFSGNCCDCKHPLLSPRATNSTNRWMTDAVAILENESIIKGEYDGYGNIGGLQILADFDATLWHEACWIVAGRPTGYRGPYERSEDQGFFFDDPAHDMPDPRQEPYVESRRVAANLTIPDDVWQDTKADEDGSAPRLLTTLVINGLHMHLEAVAVEMTAGFQTTANAEEDERFGDLHSGAGGDGPFHTTTIRGREFVVFATPYCD